LFLFRYALFDYRAIDTMRWMRCSAEGASGYGVRMHVSNRTERHRLERRTNAIGAHLCG
jgi:hypothetical protein